MRYVFVKLGQIVFKNYWLVAILILASVLRFMGTNPGYNQYHADEGITYSAAASMVKNGNLDPLRYDYPALVPLVNYVFFQTVFIPLNWAKYYISHIPQIMDGLVHIPIAPLEEKKIFQTVILGERDRNALFWGRYVTAFISVANVLLIYLVASKLFSKIAAPLAGKFIGLIAAFLLTFNFKHVINSHIGLPDIYNAFFMMLAMLMFINLWHKPTFKNYLYAGIAAGLSFSVKFQVFALVSLGLVHIYISSAKSRINIKQLFSPVFFIAVMATPVIFVILNPYFLAHFKRSVSIVAGVSQKYGVGANQFNFYPFSYFYHIDYGPIEFILMVVGLVIAIYRFKKESLLLLSYLIPFMYVLVYYSRGGFYVRNFITTTPILMIFAAIAIWTGFNFVRRRIGYKAAVVILVITLPVVVIIPGRNALINSYSYTKPWGYDQMRPWVTQNLPKDVIVASHPFDIVNLKVPNKHTEFEISGAYSMAEHQEDGALYDIFNLNYAGYPFYFWMSYGLDELPLYWNKPLDIMRNMYHGLAAEQMFRYQVHAVTKPWQAPDTHIIIVKNPIWPVVDMKVLRSFSFDKDVEGWAIYGREKRSDENFVFDPGLGHDAKGSIIYLPSGQKYPTVRITSLPIPIKAGFLYNVSGFLKTDLVLEPREREGFIRVDFYNQNPDLEKVGLISAVSARVHSSNDWVKKELIERAPQGAKFLTVSFQTQVTTKLKIWLDDVVVQESKNVVDDITSKPPYDYHPIDLNYIYPNSHGNL